MSRKFYQELAKELASKRPPIENKPAFEQWTDFVSSMIDVCKDDNPRFNVETFLAEIERG